MNNTIMNIELVKEHGLYLVSSKEIAAKFGKRHDNVLRSYIELREKIKGNKFQLLNFEENKINTLSGNEELSEVLMTRDGFSLLAFGFTGKEALEWKIKFLEAFNQMEQTIKNEIPKLKEQIRQLQMHARSLPAVKKEHGNKNTVLVPVQIPTLYGEDIVYRRVQRADNRHTALSYKEGELKRLSQLAEGMTKRINEIAKELALERRR